MPRKKIRLDLTDWGGLGDTAQFCWISDAIELYSPKPNFIELLNLLGVENGQPGGEVWKPAYDNELADGGNKTRIEYLCEWAGIEATPKRPTPNIPANAWVSERIEKMGRKPLVVFMPKSTSILREWPVANWAYVSWELREAGYNTCFFLESGVQEFSSCVNLYFGRSLTEIAGIMQNAALVIAPDSFGIHLAASLDVPALAVMGPTKHSVVFGMYPKVQSVTAKLACTGCHFHKDKLDTVVCQSGCRSLYMTDAAEVVAKAKEMLMAHST